jgi:hypothetical protein
MSKSTQKSSQKVLTILLAVVIGSGLSYGATPAQASSTKTLGDLSGKWSFPSVVKLAKGNCGTIPISFKLGPRSLKEGTASTSFGYSMFFLYTSAADRYAGEVVSWSSFKLESGGTSIKFKMKYCKEDWQNDDGDFLAGLKTGTISVAAITNDDQEFYTKIKVTK